MHKPIDPPAQPPDALNRLRARVYEAISDVTARVGCAPAAVTVGKDEHGRHGEMIFDSLNDAAAWTSWLHWPYATSNRDGQILLQAFGQWLGFSWRFAGSEPLIPEPAPAHREA